MTRWTTQQDSSDWIFSFVRHLGNKTAPPVLSGEIPILQKQNEYHSEKLSPQRDLIGWEHPISLHHHRAVIKWLSSHSYSSYNIKTSSFVIHMEWYDWMDHILLHCHFVFVFVIWQGQFHPFFNENKNLFLFCFCFCCT